MPQSNGRPPPLPLGLQIHTRTLDRVIPAANDSIVSDRVALICHSELLSSGSSSHPPDRFQEHRNSKQWNIFIRNISNIHYQRRLPVRSPITPLGKACSNYHRDVHLSAMPSIRLIDSINGHELQMTYACVVKCIAQPFELKSRETTN